ncbi:MAG: MoaD/ThiS family protein [Bryobacteraceae bacterium]
MPNEQSMMRVSVRFFSQLREAAGASEEEVELPASAEVADLLARLYQLHPGLEKWDRHLLIGVGLEFVERNYLLQPDEEIALMPPVQGG